MMKFSAAEMDATIRSFMTRIAALEREARGRELHHFETEQLLARVKGLHRQQRQPRIGGLVICDECGSEWPCETARILEDFT